MQQGVREYEKRLSKYVKLETFEVKDDRLPKNNNHEEIKKIQTNEQNRIIEKVDKNAYLIILDPTGIQFSSEDYAKKIKEFENSGVSNINFIIGGTLGFTEDFKNNADMLLSFSKMTFPHQLMRLFLLEQTFRVFKINRGEPYHMGF